MKNAGLELAQAGLKIAGRDINNNELTLVHDLLKHMRYQTRRRHTLTAESEEELKSFLMKMKEEKEKVALNSTFRKLRSWHLVPSLQCK